MKIALVHDYLAQDGGAERVLKAFHELWPQAPIFVLFHDKKNVPYIPKKNIQPSFIQHFPFSKKLFRWYLPLMPLATEKHDLKNYDIVLSCTSSFAKGILTPPETAHICYCHTPPRYLWSDSNEYLEKTVSNPLLKIIAQRTMHKLRIWDKAGADRVDYFLCNSDTIKKRIKKYYRRDAEVVYPPLEEQTECKATKIGNYYLAGGRLVPYKKIDMVARAFNRLGKPLKIFGIGPQLNYLKKIAKPNIEFLGKVDEQLKNKLFSECRAFINPQLEDFGITVLESARNGRPVIAYRGGGALETVIEGVTGTFFEKQTVEHLIDAVHRFNPYDWNEEKIRQHAQNFNKQIFQQKIKNIVEEKYREYLVNSN